LEALVQTHHRLLDLTDNPQEQRQRLLQLAQLLETRLERHEEAFHCLRVIHEKFPAEATHNDAMRRMAEEHDLWSQLLEVMAEDAARAQTDNGRITLMMRMAQLLEEQIGSTDEAFEVYRECFAQRPEQGAALKQLERLAQLEPRRWPVVMDHYEQLVDQTDDLEQVVQLFWTMAERKQGAMESPRAAFDTLKRALDMGLDEDKTLQKLHAIADSAGFWPDLIDVYDQRWSELDGFPEEQLPILADTAELILEHLDQPAQAVDRYARAFRLDPWNDTVRARLHTLVAQQESWPLLLDLYESAIETSYERQDATSQAKFLSHIADVYLEASDDHDRAFDALMRAFHATSADVTLRKRLEEVGEHAGRLGEVAQAYRDMAEQSPPEIALVFLLGAARILDEHQQQPLEAIGVLREAMQIDSDNGEIQHHMEALLRAQNDVESLIDLYIQRSERSVDRQARYTAYLQVAELMAESDDPDRAVEYFRRALRLEPNNLAIYNALVTLHDRLGQDEHTARTLEQIIEVTSDHDIPSLAASYDRLGDLYVKVQRPTRAIDALRKLLELRPGRLDAVDRLETIMRDTERFDDLMKLLDGRVTVIDQLLEELKQLDQEPQTAGADLSGPSDEGTDPEETPASNDVQAAEPVSNGTQAAEPAKKGHVGRIAFLFIG
ncbi:MAG: tetratricopeptide repeat protein, partial [Myxococcota bacterium]